MHRYIAFFVLSAFATGYAWQSNTPWPPGLHRVGDESPVLSPQDSMKTMFMPPGYRLELVASEPMIQEPVAIDWDADGRLWVVEMPGYMEDMPATTEREPSGLVSVLEDTDGDGKMDRKTVFLDKLVLPRAIKVLDKGVLIGVPPNLLYARDTDGDLKADTQEVVTDSYGQEMANVEHNENSLLWAMDNWIHTSEGSTLLRWKKGRFEVRKTLPRGQWGATQDDAGRVYRNTNQSALFVDIVPTPYYARNPNLLRTRGSYDSLGGEALNETWPVRPTPGVNRGYQDGVLRPDGRLASFTSVSAPTVYRGDRLPDELYGDVFVVEPAANLVSRIEVFDDGTTLRGKKAYERAEFIASTDERFRPVNLSSAPDGTLYVVDMYHGIIQHKGYITEYLRDQILARKLDRPQGHGRIYRVVHETTKRADPPKLSAASPERLVELLSHPNGWWRDTAQELLVQRDAQGVVPQLAKLAAGAPDWRTRLHALWTLDGLDRIEPSAVERALQDASRDVRAAAVRVSERWMGADKHPIQAKLIECLDDKDWAVRRQLAATLGALPAGSPVKIEALTTLLERHGDDPIVVDAALSGLSGDEPAVLRRLIASGAATPQRTEAATTLAATIVKSGQDAAIQDLLRLGRETQAPWVRGALLAGAEAALLDAPLPGSPRRQRPAASPNSAAPGGRAGPGGAPAFAKPETASARGRGIAPAPVRLATAPAALLDLAAAGGEMGKRAEALLARLTWPGKAQDAASAAEAKPLTPEEQKRFEAGGPIYGTLCAACHGEDGRGVQDVAPGLIGSAFALGPAGVPARILLHGKEGNVGLMPPLGSVLNDEQVAAVLTYTRRSWGNQATAVDPATVQQVRKETADRLRPWNEEELKKLTP